MSRKLRVGVIGVGSMGRNHVRVYKELGVELVGIADADTSILKSVSDQFQVPSFADCEQLLGQKLDAVSIVVPTAMHHDIVCQALDCDVNVLVEKPLADKIERGRSIVDRANASGKVVMVGHIERFNPAVQKLKGIIDDGVLGDLITLSSRRVGPFVERVKDVGIIVDIGTHDIDIARYLTGAEPVHTYGKLHGIKHRKGDCAFVILDFEDITSSIELNWFTPHRVRSLIVTGSKGIAYVDYSEQTVVLYNSGWKMEPKIAKEEPLKAEIKHFLECVENGSKPLVTCEDALRTLKLAIEIEKEHIIK